MKTAGVVLAMFAAAILVSGSAVVRGDEPPYITKDELKARLGNPEVAVVDVRGGGDWAESDRKIAGAVRGDPGDTDAWAEGYPKDKTLIVYCA